MEKIKRIIIYTLAGFCGIIIGLQPGCATRDYVDRKDTAHRYLSQTDAIVIHADLRQPAFEKINELDSRLSALEAERPPNRESTIDWDQLEKDIEKAAIAASKKTWYRWNDGVLIPLEEPPSLRAFKKVIKKKMLKNRKEFEANEPNTIWMRWHEGRLITPEEYDRILSTKQGD